LLAEHLGKLVASPSQIGDIALTLFQLRQETPPAGTTHIQILGQVLHTPLDISQVALVGLDSLILRPNLDRPHRDQRQKKNG
jgi:hypothetical protein